MNTPPSVSYTHLDVYKRQDVHIVLNGPGAAGTAIIKMLMTAGAKDIIAVDQFGTCLLYTSRCV